MDAHDEKHPEGILPSWRTVTAGDKLELGEWIPGLAGSPAIGRSDRPDADVMCCVDPVRVFLTLMQARKMLATGWLSATRRHSSDMVVGKSCALT